MAVHRKAVALMEPMEAMARLAARAQSRAEAAQTRASGSASYDNGDGTRTVIGPQTGSATMATHVGDLTPPPVPTGIRAWSGDGSLHVLWAGSLDGDAPADFDHVTILVDGAKVAEMRSAGSVTVDGLAVGATVSVTATAEDDACLADGTPAHNISAPCTAISITIRDVMAEAKAEADEHATQISDIQKDIADYKDTAEATYATKTEVDSKTGAISKTLTADYTRTADLASTEAVRDAKAAGTAAQASIDGMRLGGRNLLKGTSMDVVTGTYQSSSYIDYLSYVTIAVPDGDTYTLSFDAKSTHAGDVLFCYFYSPNTTLTGTSSTGGSSTSPDGFLRVKLTEDWQRYWCTWTQGATTKRKGVIPFRCNAGQGSGTVSMRGVKLEAGNRATDWTPAPEDTDSAVADAKKAGTGAASALDSYKGVVKQTYAEKTELTEAVNQLSSTMTSNYSAFVDYRQSNDTAVSKAQSDATNAQSTIDSYKQSNDQAVADAKAAGTTAQDQLNSYKSSNDAAVADAKAAGTTAQSNLDSYKTTTDQLLDELKNIADNAIESFYLKGAPTASNPPASSWTTDALKKQHAGDLYMDTDTGYSYRWSGTEWVQVKDSDVTKALNEIESVKTTYATKSELSATDTELSGKVSDALTTAKSYTDGSVAKEATARDAAIKASADSISLDVSKTYTKSDTFSAYQADADSRIATANSNASTAVSTAKTAASDAATAKTNASTAKTTADGAASIASSAKSVADSASSTANAASTSASNAVSTANAANSTAQTANATAQTAKSTADTAKTTADDAYSRTLRVQVESSPADATGDTSALTATVWRGGERLTEQEVAMMGLVAWYVGGSRASTGYTYTCAAGTAVECRLDG